MARTRSAKTVASASRSTSVQDLIVHADPDKLFFISMLVKDIELVPAVLDLVDNSVDGARAMAIESGKTDTELPFRDRRISITANDKVFEIKDNCGGIALDTARNYAFRFGRPKDYNGVAGSVGQFGVGMKRSLFKLGKKFEVKSRTYSDSFDLNVDVDEWAKQTSTEWTFTLSSAKQNLRPPPSAELGTTIKISALHGTVSEDFSDHIVIGQLREQLRLRHQGAIQQGLRVELNGERLTGLRPQLLSGPNFSPFNRTTALHEPGGLITVQVIAGIAAADSQSDNLLDDGKAQDFRTAGDAGWWLFCNDRLLLYADRTHLTGWGDAGASYHPQYRRFRGYVYLTAADTSLLPWNTTKTGIDQDSRVWRQVRSIMMVALTEVQSVINRIKTEGEGSEDPDQTSVTVAVAGATPVPVSDLEPSENVKAPSPPVKKRRQPKNEQKMQFNVDRTRYQEVASVLKAQNSSEVGRSLFEYFYDREIDG